MVDDFEERARRRAAARDEWIESRALGAQVLEELREFHAGLPVRVVAGAVQDLTDRIRREYLKREHWAGVPSIIDIHRLRKIRSADDGVATQGLFEDQRAAQKRERLDARLSLRLSGTDFLPADDLDSREDRAARGERVREREPWVPPALVWNQLRPEILGEPDDDVGFAADLESALERSIGLRCLCDGEEDDDLLTPALQNAASEDCRLVIPERHLFLSSSPRFIAVAAKEYATPDRSLGQPREKGAVAWEADALALDRRLRLLVDLDNAKYPLICDAASSVGDGGGGPTHLLEPAQWRVLEILGSQGRTKQAVIADRLGVSTRSIARESAVLRNVRGGPLIEGSGKGLAILERGRMALASRPKNDRV